MALVAIANEHSYYEFKHCSTAYNFEDYNFHVFCGLYSTHENLSMKISWLHILRMYEYSKDSLAIHKKKLS